MDKIKNWILGAVVVGLIVLAIVVWKLPSANFPSVDEFVNQVQSRLGALSLTALLKDFTIGGQNNHWECVPLQQGTSTLASIRANGTTTPSAWTLNITTGTSTALRIDFATSTTNSATTSMYASFTYASATNANYIATSTWVKDSSASAGTILRLPDIANPPLTYYVIKAGGGNDFSANGSAYNIGGTACIKLNTL